MKREDGKEEKTGNGTHSLAHSLKSLIDNLEFYGYSYGELLRTVYCWGRVDEEGKEMVRCLLAFYSLELTRSYYRYRLADEKNNAAAEKEKRKKVFVRVMNGTIAGSWANKMFPRFFSSHEHPYRDLIGARTDVKLERVFRIKIALGKCFQGKADKNGKFHVQDIQMSPSLMDEMKKIFRSVLVLGMFFERQYYKVDKAFVWNLQVPERSTKISDFWKAGDDLSYGDTDVDICCSSSGTGFFNLFSFVSNAFQYEENVKTLMLSLYQTLFVETDEDSQMRFMKKLGIEQEFLNWHRYSGGFALPIYDMDLCYNLMKRVRQREMPDEISAKNNGWQEYVKILRFMKEKLVGNDKWYKDILKDQEPGAIHLAGYGRGGGQQGYHIHFADAFCKCPYLAWILDEDDGMLVNDFPQLFQNMLELLVVKDNSNAPQSDDKEYSGYDD